ncbi:MAG: alpha/beta hydrolase [Gemmatimonadetes bacterium]|nr:alpha/beta hydrolase [Gemmatimonadota bacterium]
MPPAPVAGPPLGRTGDLRDHPAFPSAFVTARDVHVWLPPGYDANARERYPVLYMHDGQNVFDPATSYGGVDWAVDEVMTRLIAEKKVRPAIVVAVRNSPKRFEEYMPQQAVKSATTLGTGVRGLWQGTLLSDKYLRFLVEELKPFIDRTYRTRPGRDDTMIMGSSMGGLISLYAMTQYPAVFGAAACVSTHWPAGDGAVIGYLASHMPSPAQHRLYFDHGTATLDSLYAPFQARADSVMRAAGWREGDNWVTRVFPGADHSERAWRVRVDVPLTFLLGTARK